jgi:hypothetical protein
MSTFEFAYRTHFSCHWQRNLGSTAILSTYKKRKREISGSNRNASGSNKKRMFGGKHLADVWPPGPTPTPEPHDQ